MCFLLAARITIDGRSGVVIVNGIELSEPYVQHNGNPMPLQTDFGPIVVPAGKLFVMDDKRDISYDSSIPGFGLVDVTDVLGKPLYSYAPRRDTVKRQSNSSKNDVPRSPCYVTAFAAIFLAAGSLTSHASPTVRNAKIPYQFKSNSYHARP